MSTNLSEIQSAGTEPSALAGLNVEQRQLLTRVLDEYLVALERGVPQDRAQLLGQHADLAPLLSVYLDSLDELNDAAIGFGGRALHTDDTLPTGGERRLGDFILVREIGRGGMGVVFEARQLSLGRRVALKVLPFAAMLDTQQIARFKNEAQAAAGLHHPNIVPVFAVGVERGVHYYAMQFIEGQSLDQVIDELSGGPPTVESSAVTALGSATMVDSRPPRRSAAPAREALLGASLTHRGEYFRTVTRLGVQAAHALHAAHGYGVIHRDIKPSNLLLDGDGKLWVTDFGLARCQRDMALTKTGDVVGTQRYMSPEQALGQAALVDQRTDVYSLGVTLYELLTLRPAFDGEGRTSWAVGEREPVPPRQLEPELPKDLETVVLKAMAGAREDRYETAEELADDLERVLDGRPTIARPPTIPDRIGRMMRRHVRFVATAAAVSLLAAMGLAWGTVLLTREKTKTEENYQRAQRHFRQAQETVDRFGSRLAERLADVPGADQLRQELLEGTLEYYQSFVKQADDDRAPRADLALTYDKIGTLSGQIGSLDRSIAAHQKAEQLLAQLVAENPEDDAFRRRLASCQNNLASALGRAGRTEDARRVYHQAIDLDRQLAAKEGAPATYRGDLALALNNLGLLESESGASGAAPKLFREAIDIQTALAAATPRDPDVLRKLAASYNNLAALSSTDQLPQAAVLFKKAAAEQAKALAERPGDAKLQSDLAMSLNNVGSALARLGHLSEAIVAQRRAIDLERHLTETKPLDRLARRDLAVSANNLGLLLSRSRQTADAQRSFAEALALQEAIVNQDPRDGEMQSSLGGIYNNLGILLEEDGKPEQAAQRYKQAVEHQQAAQRSSPEVDRYRQSLSKHYYNYGRAMRKLGRPEQAAEAALARKKLWPGDAKHLFSIAEELALASQLLADQPAAALSAADCRREARQTLSEAVAAGYKLPAGFEKRAWFAALSPTRKP